ncbi:hypothetical protein EKO27_g10080 [Xylaria grammica]|uniref:Nop domain-containing protein n=1 Tax=Xylaria grammica TaxID=363999 RepID=A0A439CS56_9PEZI|nr:hypothetical protein EKO27_g10080 [Xylaria grammica]
MSDLRYTPTAALKDHVGAAQFRVKDHRGYFIRVIKTYRALNRSIHNLTKHVRVAFDEYFHEILEFLSNDATYCRFALYVNRQTDLDIEDQEQKELANADPILLEAVVTRFREQGQLDALKTSISISETVMVIAKMRASMLDFLEFVMPKIVPNLTKLVGPVLAASFIEKAGSLEELVKKPASTIQLFGVEDAFRNAKTNGTNTPKHGFIYTSDIVQQVPQSKRGRVSRLLACKCVLAARHDFFTDDITAEFGHALRQEVIEKSQN